MRRVRFPGGVVASIVLLAIAVTAPVLAQDASPGMSAGHPVVGSWLVDTNADDPGNPPSSVSFHADGTIIEVDVDGVGVGAWEPTGAQTAAATFIYHQTDETGALSTVTVRADVEVAPDGQNLTASFTIDFAGPDSPPTGQLGPGRATGTRMTVDPVGTPVGPLPGASPGASPAASPAASPVAGVAAAGTTNNKACTLEYQRADNMWAAEGRPDGDLGIESITLLPGQRKVFVTDWRYERLRNDGSNYYGSHLRLARVPFGSGPTRFWATNVWGAQNLVPGSGWKSYRNDLEQVLCPSWVAS